jgi:hypothetical protein
MNEETLFELARHAPPAEREAILDRECAGNPELRRRVERLLAAHDTPETVLVSPAMEFSDDLGYSLGSEGASAFRNAPERFSRGITNCCRRSAKGEWGPFGSPGRRRR